jgi:two-component system response regulator HupR/HoxA
MTGPALLVVDDEAPVLALVPQLFAGEFPVLTARNGAEALARIAEHEVGVVIADQRMPGMAGTELLARIAAEKPDVVRIVLTAYADTENLLEAINAGQVFQFVTKPWDNRELQAIVRRGMETYRLRVQNAQLLGENTRLVGELKAANEALEHENRALRSEVGDRYRLGTMIGASQPMQEVFRLLEKAAHSAATVLLAGETGTGKELVARQVHDSGPRRGRTFVAVNCGSLPDTLLESELFGHVKGAFTGALRDRRGLFEEAHGGTVFLDEIGEMSPSMQIKVLRVVEDGCVRPVGASQNLRVDVRLVCATNRDLRAEVEAGTFRRDLFYRLNVFPIALPPLRGRDGDVTLLATHFLHRYDSATAKGLRGISPPALRCLQHYPWPGNVRELKNEIERAVALAEPGDTIDLQHLSPEVTGDRELVAAAQGNGTLTDRLDRIEQLLIVDELRRHGENRTHTARTLGISVRALQKKIGKYGLRDREE